ncbi:MAG: lipid-A-disaccharide synthase [Candidatus Cloacimonetes bacterium]|nr:lipid-A-disaccharide synthase [Candidatus Cloacimonadota bacterium]
MKEITIFWLAGESSGDLHAELIMKALAESGIRYRHIGIGGPRMRALGLESLFPFQRFAVMGFVEVIKHLGFFWKVERRIKKLFKRDKLDLVILVDYPGLNLRIAHHADEQRIPVLYYICPQFWAWKHERVYKLKANVRHTACILPFEEELLNIHNVTCSYVGHPISEEVNIEMERESFAFFYKLAAEKEWLGLFPGSRDSEIRKMLPLYLKAAKSWTDKEILVSKAHSVNHQLFMDIISEYNLPNLHIIDGYTYEMMKYSEALICTSGTATLEAAYIGTPAVICYRANPISYLIGRYFVRISHIGLPNIILNESVLPELVQNGLNPEGINRELKKLMSGSPQREEILKKLYKLRAILSDKKPSREVPLIIEKLLKIHGKTT